MSHYAKVQNGYVTKVIVAEAEFFDTFVDDSPGEWIQTSYNTRSGVHYKPNSDEPSEDQSKALRKNYAGIGFEYNKELDAFISPKPYPSWVHNEDAGHYEDPITYPNDGMYDWNEENQQWVEIE